MNRIVTLLLTSTTLALLVACGGGGSSSSNGTLSVSLTDAPVDEADAVVVHFTKATIQPASGERFTVDIIDPLTNLPGRSVDLLQLTGDKSTVLFDESLVAGDYSWIRLDVDFDPLKTYIDIAGQQYALDCTSCENNGLKLNRTFTVDADNTQAITLDFDLRKSITKPQSQTAYKLRPTIRIIDTEGAGKIMGNIDADLITQLTTPDGDAKNCIVYVYAGLDITPDDIYLPETGNAPAAYNNPVTTAPAELDSASGDYQYMAAFLPEGSYTVSLTCNADLDNTELDDSGIEFTGTANVDVTATMATTHDFSVPMTPIAAP